jgi:hypothetical protein
MRARAMLAAAAAGAAVAAALPSCVNVPGAWTRTAAGSAEYVHEVPCAWSVDSPADVAAKLGGRTVMMMGDSTARYLADHIAQWVQPAGDVRFRKGDSDAYRVATMDAVGGFAVGLEEMRDLSEALGGHGAPTDAKEAALLHGAYDAVVINAAFWPLRAWHVAWGNSLRRYTTCEQIRAAYKAECEALADRLRPLPAAARARIWMRTSTGLEPHVAPGAPRPPTVPGSLSNPCYSQEWVHMLNAIAGSAFNGVIPVLDMAPLSHVAPGAAAPWTDGECCHTTFDGMHASERVNALMARALLSAVADALATGGQPTPSSSGAGAASPSPAPPPPLPSPSSAATPLASASGTPEPPPAAGSGAAAVGDGNDEEEDAAPIVDGDGAAPQPDGDGVGDTSAATDEPLEGGNAAVVDDRPADNDAGAGASSGGGVRGATSAFLDSQPAETGGLGAGRVFLIALFTCAGVLFALVRSSRQRLQQRWQQEYARPG